MLATPVSPRTHAKGAVELVLQKEDGGAGPNPPGSVQVVRRHGYGVGRGREDGHLGAINPTNDSRKLPADALLVRPVDAAVGKPGICIDGPDARLDDRGGELQDVHCT